MNDDELESRIVWILGTARSGSTWVLRMLTRATCGVPLREPLIGAHLGLSLSDLLGMTVLEDRPIADAMGERLSYFFSRDSEEAWRPALRTLLLNRIRYEVEPYKTMGQKNDRPVIVKEPWGAGGASLILETLPRSRVLFLQRDGRDVVDSLLDGADDGWISKWYGATVPDRACAIRDYARLWVRSMNAVQRAYEHHEPSHLRHSVHYEALVDDTTTQLTELVQWLDCDPHLVADVARSCQFDNEVDVAKGPGKLLRSGTPGLWQHDFSDAEKDVLEEVMGPALHAFGYH